MNVKRKDKGGELGAKLPGKFLIFVLQCVVISWSFECKKEGLIRGLGEKPHKLNDICISWSTECKQEG